MIRRELPGWAASDEYQFLSGSIRRIADINHLVPGGVQIGLNLIPLPEAQRGPGMQGGAVAMEEPRSLKGD